MNTIDRFGMTWHPALAPDMARMPHRLDVLEVIPEVALAATRGDRDYLRILARELPFSLHAVSLGMASASRVDEGRLEDLARLIEDVRPESWSEHLAFVRAGEIELGHLASPPRSDAVLDGLSANLRRARRITGTTPALENVSTLFEPPGSTRTEAEWLCDVMAATDAPLLLDLHNVCTNAVNLGFDAEALIRSIPLNRVQTVHIAGGADEVDPASGVTLRIDDHRHEVPPNVYQLLTLVGELAPQGLTVVLEREGAPPPFEGLLAELDRARVALAAGRRAARSRTS